MKNQINILIVDDDRSTRLLLKTLLKNDGYFTRECEDGLKAIEILSHDRFHMVITDLRMPNMDGNKLLSEIQRIENEIEVIIISAYGDIDVAVELMRNGAYDFVRKPIDEVKLLNTVKQCAEKCLLKSENLELKERAAFFEINKALNSTLDLKSLLNLIMDCIQKVMPADQGSIMLFDQKNNMLSIEASFGLEGKLKKSHNTVLPGSPVWKVLDYGECVIISNVPSKYPMFKEVKGHRNIKSSMIIPLTIKDKTIGVLNLSRTKIISDFTNRDLSMLTVFAGQAASAMENAYLYRKLESYSRIVIEEKEEIEAIVDNISDGIIVCEYPDNIILINPSARAIFMMGAAIIIGKSYYDIFHNKGLESIATIISEFNNIENDFVEKKIILNIDGENKHLRITIAALETGKNRKGLIILDFEDLTKLVQIHKMAAWQDMARSLAHEVKNPLTPILWATEAMLEKTTEHTEKYGTFIEKNCNTIIREVKRIQTLISNFSSLAKLPEPKLKPESIEPVLQEILMLYSNLPDIKIETYIEEDLPLITMDGKMVKQVFINLIKNAIEAMPDGGELSISCRVQPDDVVSIVFRDTGKGIPEKIMDHIFDPYFTTKKTGTGLGLTISTKIMHDHQGQIRVISKENEGTTFIVNFPVT